VTYLGGWPEDFFNLWADRGILQDWGYEEAHRGPRLFLELAIASPDYS